MQLYIISGIIIDSVSFIGKICEELLAKTTSLEV